MTDILEPGISCKTIGDGYWSNIKADVDVYRISVSYVAEDQAWGELRVYFDPDQWNTDSDGLIYTDSRFLEEFRSALVEKLGFTKEAINEVGYSEMGMQGYDWVSLDINGTNFLREWRERGLEYPVS